MSVCFCAVRNGFRHSKAVVRSVKKCDQPVLEREEGRGGVGYAGREIERE